MKLKLLAAFLCMIALAAPTWAADPGNPDTLLMVVTASPDANAATVDFVMEVWAYSDEAVIGAAAGFCWDNLNMAMDSAIGSPGLDSAFEIGPFFYENNSIEVTNANRRFLVGGSKLFGAGLPPADIRRLWATYYFTLSNWSVTDSIVLDTCTFNAGTAYKFVASDQSDIFPIFGGKLVIKDPNAPVPVNMIVDSTALAFDAVAGGTNPFPASFNVTSDGESVDFAISEGASWLIVVPASGNSPSMITALIDISGMSDGVYTEDIIITSATATNSPITIPVTLTLDPPPPVIVADPTSVAFDAFEGGANPADQEVAVTNSGGGTLNLSISTAEAWLTAVLGGSNVITLSVEVGALAPGSYSDDLVITDPAASNSPVTVPVTFEVIAPPVIAVDQPEFYFEDSLGGTPAPQLLTITNDGGDALDVTLTNSTAWLMVAPTQGGPEPITINLSIDITGMAVGMYYDTVIISDGNATNSPFEVPVSYKITGALAVTPSVLTFGILNGGGAQVQSFHVAEASDEAVAFTIAKNAAWLTLDKDNSVTPDDIAVTADPTGLARGAYYDTLEVAIVEKAGPALVTVTLNVLNNLPVIDAVADVAVSHRGSLDLTITASDADGDEVALTVTPAVDNLTFNPATGQLLFNPAVDQVGDYVMTITANDGFDEVSTSFTITVEFECNAMALSQTEYWFTFNVIYPDLPIEDQMLTVSSDYLDFCFEVLPDAGSTWLTQSSPNGCTDAGETIAFNIDGAGLGVGTYDVLVSIIGDGSVCDPATQTVMIYLEVIDDPVIVPEDPDTLAVGMAGAVPGAQATVPINFTNLCDLVDISAVISWEAGEVLTLDSAIFGGSRVDHLFELSAVIDNSLRTATIDATVNDGEDMIFAGSGLLVNLYYSVAVGSAPGYYPVVSVEPAFVRDCGSGPIPGVAEVTPGGVVIDAATNYVCGYVVDPDGLPIAGATVELWADYPGPGPLITTTTNGDGAFGIADPSATIPFDLYAHHSGYYPNTKLDLNFNSIPRNIVLTPLRALPSPLANEWVDYFCDANTFYTFPLPAGAVVEAIDDDGTLCGQFYVETAGEYGFMPVYRDDPGTAEDEGAELDDLIQFYVNGSEVLTSGNTLYPVDWMEVQVCIEAGIVMQTALNISSGWNLVSWNLNTEDDNVEVLMSALSGCIDVILGFEQGGLTWDPDLPQFSTLHEMSHLSAYWVLSTCDVILDIEGLAVPITTPIAVTPGWNLVSYLPSQPLATEVALESVHGDLIVATGFMEGAALTYKPGDPTHSTLTELVPHYGYWVKVSSGGFLRYPGAGPVFAFDPADLPAAKNEGLDVIKTNSWMDIYSSELTLDGDPVGPGSVITAHTESGLTVGIFEMETFGTFGFMPIYGDDPATAEIEGLREGDSFYLRINGTETNEAITFTAAGSRMEISGVTARTTTPGTLPDEFSLDQNYPNPFNPSTTIAFTLPVSGHVKIAIYNILGKQVAVAFDGPAEAGRSEVVWDGHDANGKLVASGIYFYRLISDNYTQTKKMTLLK